MLSWAKIAAPAVALAIGAVGTAAGFILTGSSDRRPPVSARPSPAVPPSDPTGGGRSMGGGSGMMGSGGAMMGPGSDVPSGAPGGLLPASEMLALAAQAARSTTRRGQTLSYRSDQVTLVVLAAPGNRPGMYWQIDGLDGPQGPAVSVPAGATVTVDFANGDPGHAHGFELIRAAPPYSRMAMMAGPVAAAGAFIMPVPQPQGTLWYAATAAFHAPPPGTYYIICPVPGHAQQGMWATFIVG